MTIRQAYAALGLDGTSAAPGDVRVRFRDLVRAHHPDRAPPGEQERANETTRLLVEAYSVLRRSGYPRVPRASREGTAAGEAVLDEPQPPVEVGAADPLAWVDEVWRESVRTRPPEDAMTAAVLRAAWWAFGSLVLAGLGFPAAIVGAILQAWIFAALGVVAAGFGMRLALAAWRMAVEVRRYWRVWARVSDRSVMLRVRRTLAVRFGLAIVALAAVAGLLRFR